MLELYHSGLTTCSKQVRLCLREKKLNYVSHYIELWNYENLSSAYLELNPNGVVPTLVHDGGVITNSLCINEYLDDAFPENPLKPVDLKERARMRLWTWTADDVHLSVTNVTYMRMLKSKVDDLSQEDKDFMVSRIPAPDRKERWSRVSSGGYTESEIRAALDKCKFGLDRMEKELAERGPWLAGGTYSLADISMLSIVHRIRELHPEMVESGGYPHINDWRDRMMARSAVELVYTPGLEETPKRPAGKSISGID